MSLSIKQGDTIVYTSAAGTQTALVENLAIGPTARENHSIVWLTLLVHGSVSKKTRDHHVRIPGDAASLKSFNVSVL